MVDGSKYSNNQGLGRSQEFINSVLINKYNFLSTLIQVPLSVLSPFLPLVIIAGLLIGHGEKVKFSGNGSK